LKISIFVKLLLLTFASWLAVMMFAGLFAWLGRGEPDRPFQALAEQLGEYLADDIGVPPNLERARALASGLGLAVVVEDPQLQWASDDDLPRSRSLRRHVRKNNVGFYRGRLFVIVERGETRYLFMDTRDDERNGRAFLLSLALALALILGGAYLMMRRLLRPVRLLAHGVGIIAGGRLAYRVPVVSRDELGDLTESFNSMTEQVQRMVLAREQLLLDVSHELRSPLTRVRLGLELIDDEKARDSLGEDVKAMERLITALLEMYRMDSPHGRLHLSELDITSIILDVAATLADVEPGVELSGCDSPARLRGDSARIGMLIRNLLDNALRYSPNEGLPVRIALSQGAEEVVVDVVDHGPGIREEDRENLFAPFFRADPSRSRQTGGYGLGLALSRRIAAAHGGRLELTGSGPGAHFRLVLPVNGPKEEPSSET
jgi:signal transduction histidine kinase